MPDWWFDELAAAGAEHLDAAAVDAYDRKAQYDPAADVDALRVHGLGPPSEVVDLGAGTGTFALAAAATGAHVTAIDVSPAMVAAMRRRVAASPAGTRVDVVEAGFLGYEHAGPPADFVFTRHALHQLPDFWKVVALRRIAALLRAGGILRVRDLVFDLEPDAVESVIDSWMAGGADDPRQGYTASDFADHVRREFSTFTWLLEPMLAHAGFDVIDREVRRGIYVAYTCRRRG